MRLVYILFLTTFFAAVVRAELPGNYESLSGFQKQALLTSRIQASQYPRLPLLHFPTCSLILGSIGTALDLKTSFTHSSDEMPGRREKVIHTYGTVAPVVFEPSPDSPFSGVFSGAPVPGLARLSLAGPPLIIGYTPGMALKLFVDGKPSVNMHVMNSVNGQGMNWNFFDRDFSNIIPQPKGLMLNLLAIRFALTAKDPTKLSLKDAASVEANGAVPSSIKTPYQVRFAPIKRNVSINSGTAVDFREDISKIPPGTSMYEVFAREYENGPEVKIGTVRTTGEFVASEYGDRELFFRHSSESLR